MNFFHRKNLTFQSLINCKNSLVSAFSHSVNNFFIISLSKNFNIQRICFKFSASYSLEQSFLKTLPDCHNFTGSFHLSSQITFCINKFVKREFRHFYNNIIKHRLKTSFRFFSNKIWNFIKSVTNCNQSSNFCNRITSCFTCQSRRTAYTRIHFNHRIFKTVWI